MTRNTELVEQLSADFRSAALEPANLAMLDYAAKLTLTPTMITEQDIHKLREAGFDDRAILDIAQITAYYAYVNRIADGLGVSLEDYWQRGENPGE